MPFQQATPGDASSSTIPLFAAADSAPTSSPSNTTAALDWPSFLAATGWRRSGEPSAVVSTPVRSSAGAAIEGSLSLPAAASEAAAAAQVTPLGSGGGDVVSTSKRLPLFATSSWVPPPAPTTATTVNTDHSSSPLATSSSSFSSSALSAAPPSSFLSLAVSSPLIPTASPFALLPHPAAAATGGLGSATGLAPSSALSALPPSVSSLFAPASNVLMGLIKRPTVPANPTVVAAPSSDPIGKPPEAEKQKSYSLFVLSPPEDTPPNSNRNDSAAAPGADATTGAAAAAASSSSSDEDETASVAPPPRRSLLSLFLPMEYPPIPEEPPMPMYRSARAGGGADTSDGAKKPPKYDERRSAGASRSSSDGEVTDGIPTYGGAASSMPEYRPPPHRQRKRARAVSSESRSSSRSSDNDEPAGTGLGHRHPPRGLVLGHGYGVVGGALHSELPHLRGDPLGESAPVVATVALSTHSRFGHNKNRDQGRRRLGLGATSRGPDSASSSRRESRRNSPAASGRPRALAQGGGVGGGGSYEYCFLVMDTSSLLKLEGPDELRPLFMRRNKVVIPWMVVHEIDGLLKRCGSQQPAATTAGGSGVGDLDRGPNRDPLSYRKLAQIRSFFLAVNDDVILQRRSQRFLSDSKHFVNDDYILDCAMYFRHEMRDVHDRRGALSSHRVVLVTEDLTLRVKARAEGVEFSSVRGVLDGGQ